MAVLSACNAQDPSRASTGSGGSSSNGVHRSGGSGGSNPSGGNRGSGGTAAAGGSAASGGSSAGGTRGTGGSEGTGGVGSSGGGGGSSGGASGSGGKATGGSSATGGASGNGGSATGGTSKTGGASGTAGSTGSGNCSFTVISNALSSKMATVGVVEWSTTLANLSSAQIVYTLNNAASGILNKGGTAPVDLTKSNYHTLLLGLKPSSDYTFHIEATASSGTTCKSGDYTLPKTGTLSGAPTVTRTAGTGSSPQEPGFIVTCSGIGGGGFGGPGGGTSGNGAFIIDADSTVVWYAAGPTQCSRARMDYEGVNMWMLALNVQNSGGEMRYMSMDGQTSQTSISGLSSAHHDFTVLPGKIAALVWASTGADPESNLIERTTSGTLTTAFKIGSNLYAGGQSAMGAGSSAYHCNSILYHSSDDSYTIGDRNPNLYVKVKHDGTPVWQIGGSCTGAKAPKCASGTWKVNHGHDFDTNGNLLIFNNGTSGNAHIFEFKLTESSSAISFTTVKDFSTGGASSSLGDVQRLPGGNTLITYSDSGQILEVDSSWQTVQTLKGGFGFADWRPTLYGPPER